MMRGQTSIEFLYTMVFMLLLFTAVLVIYGMAQGDLVEISQGSEFRAACHAAASQISAIASSGSGTAAVLSLPEAKTQYTVYVSGSDRTVIVAAWERMASCRISTTNVSNGTASSFSVADGARMANINGGVVFG
jgi:hypothetical protein